MLSFLSIYLAFAKTALLRQASFKLANLSGLFTNTFFMLFRAAIFQALFAEANTIAGYNLDNTLTYVVMIQVFIMVIPQWGSIGVSEDLKTGQIAMDLIRPINYYLMILAKRLGVSIFYLFARGLPALGIGMLFGFFRVPPTVPNFLWCSCSLLLSIILANSLHFLVELSGFWLESSKGPKRLITTFLYFFSGAVIPTAFFPAWAQQINNVLPFQYTLNSPIEVMMGTTNNVVMLSQQLMWVVIIGALCIAALKRGERKLVLHGG